MNKPSILKNKFYSEPSVFNPENLLREARRQKHLENCPVPEVCILDPDGDLARYLEKVNEAKENECWACYHSELFTYDLNGTQIGIVPCAVGASYAVLIAEQLFVSGCKLLISVTSAGIITDEPNPKQFALITEAVRDEGTSYHYLSPEKPSRISTALYDALSAGSANDEPPYFEAKSWTTDAPYRETQSSIDAMKQNGVTCVEMEASALYAFAEYTQNNILCFAHLTNSMAQKEGDFEKGEEFGSLDTLRLIKRVLRFLSWS